MHHSLDRRPRLCHDPPRLPRRLVAMCAGSLDDSRHAICSFGAVITCDSTPFGDGPVRHLDGLLALPRFQRATAARRAAVAFFISWPPLVALALWEGISSGNDVHRSLCADFLVGGLHGRQ